VLLKRAECCYSGGRSVATSGGEVWLHQGRSAVKAGAMYGVTAGAVCGYTAGVMCGYTAGVMCG
jgi:hypothetical protein